MKACWRPAAVAVLVGWLTPLTAFAVEDREQLAPAISARGEQVGGSPATASELERYAEREKQADLQEQFAGGEGVGIYIGGAALIILAVVLIILLLR